MRTSRPRELLLLEADPDDVEIFRFVVDRIRLPIHTTVVTDEDEMEARLQQRPRPDIIMVGTDICDRRLERLLARRKSDPKTGHIPIVVLTDDDDPEHVKECYAHHAAACVIKPVGMEDYEGFARALHAFWFETAHLPPPD